MTDGQALLAAVEAAGEDLLPRLVYADWVDEGNGDEADRARVAMIRTMTGYGMTKKQMRMRAAMLLEMNWRLLMPRLAASGRQVEVDPNRCCLKVLTQSTRFGSPDVQVFVDGAGMLTSCRYKSRGSFIQLSRMIDADLVAARHLAISKPYASRHVPGDSRGRVVPITGQAWYAVFIHRSAYSVVVVERLAKATESGYIRDVIEFTDIPHVGTWRAGLLYWAEANTKKSGGELSSRLYRAISDCMTAAVKGGDDLEL